MSAPSLSAIFKMSSFKFPKFFYLTGRPYMFTHLCACFSIIRFHLSVRLLVRLIARRCVGLSAVFCVRPSFAFYWSIQCDWIWRRKTCILTINSELNIQVLKWAYTSAHTRSYQKTRNCYLQFIQYFLRQSEKWTQWKEFRSGKWCFFFF